MVESRRVKILALVTDGFGVGGGIARYNCDLMNALSKSARVSEVVVLPRFGAPDARPPEKVLQRKALSSASHWAAMAGQLALRGRFDVIFCGHLNAAAFVASIARLFGARLWIQAHGIEAWADRGPGFRRALTDATLVTSVSRYTRRRLLSWSDLDPSKARVLPNTFDQAYAPRATQTDLAARYGLDGKRIILTVGRMSSSERYKGHDRVISSLGVVRLAVPEAVYLIVGAGDDQPRLHAMARDLGVGDAVVFAGHVPADEIASHYGLADVFVMPSTGEGFGIVFLEAAASGLAVIGGNRDGSLDALADGSIGVAVDPEDISALRNAIIAGLTRARRRRPEAVHRFSFSNFANQVDDLVQHLSR